MVRKGNKYLHGFKKKKKNVICLQETLWRKEWGGPIVFSHGLKNSRGVMSLFNKHFSVIIQDTVMREDMLF